MNDDVAIRVSGVTKVFKLPHEKSSSIKSSVINFYRRKKTFELQKALEDISFDIKEGEFFGIVGRNGSGKSTLLKLLAGIYTPTKGNIQVNGKLTPFIELGVGFNPELTGRENVFLNGALLGFNRKEMEAMYEDIVNFAEIHKFMDQKLKNYSSGMQVRLAFSIAIRAKSDILVLDEVLAVGDAAFQQKCVEVFERYKAEKLTVVLVTHDMETVRRFCTRAALLEDGKLVDIGEPNLIAGKYARLNQEVIEKDIQKTQTASKIRIQIKQHGQGKVASYDIGQNMSAHMSWPRALKGVKNAGIAVIKNDGEYIFGANTLEKGMVLKKPEIKYDVKLDLGPGKYYLMGGLFGDTKYDVIDFVERGPEFIIRPSPEETSYGTVRLEHEWSSEQ